MRRRFICSIYADTCSGSGHREVQARQCISQSEFDDFAVLLTFASGTIGTFVTSAHAGWSYPFQRLEIMANTPPSVEDMERKSSMLQA